MKLAAHEVFLADIADPGRRFTMRYNVHALKEQRVIMKFHAAHEPGTEIGELPVFHFNDSGGRISDLNVHHAQNIKACRFR